jgi:hypothetical protein
MKRPTMSLRDVQRILDEQNRSLLAAYRALDEGPAGRPIAPSTRALERLREACAVGPIPATTIKVPNGIRC